MRYPITTTVALATALSLSLAGCSVPDESPSSETTAEMDAAASATDMLENSAPSILDSFADVAPEEGTDAGIAWFALMGPDGEYAAAAMYQAVIDEYGDVEPYVSIREGEERHIDALTRQLERMGYDVPENPYLGGVEAPADLQTAAEAWAEGEIANVEMYDDLLTQTDNETLVRVLENLRRASLESHLPLFELAAANGGSLTPEQMPATLGASHSGDRKADRGDQAMRAEKRGAGHGPGHRS